MEIVLKMIDTYKKKGRSEEVEYVTGAYQEEDGESVSHLAPCSIEILYYTSSDCIFQQRRSGDGA